MTSGRGNVRVITCCLVVVLPQASWIINAREPDERDITAAFLVFQPSEQLTSVLHSMPQVTGSLLCCSCRTCVQFKSRFGSMLCITSMIILTDAPYFMS
jgi:hypothetical protein